MKLLEAIKNKRGSEMVEASISMPIVIIAILLLIRLLVFYVEILTTSIDEHNTAWKAWREYNGKTISCYQHTDSVEILKGGLLSKNIKKVFETKIYLFNEDYMVRLGEAFNQE